MIAVELVNIWWNTSIPRLDLYPEETDPWRKKTIILHILYLNHADDYSCDAEYGSLILHTSYLNFDS